MSISKLSDEVFEEKTKLHAKINAALKDSGLSYKNKAKVEEILNQ
jgi:hypothetical protein